MRTKLLLLALVLVLGACNVTWQPPPGTGANRSPYPERDG
jgi:hypothetical protein